MIVKVSGSLGTGRKCREEEKCLSRAPICHLRHGSQVGAVPTVFTQKQNLTVKSGPIESHEEAAVLLMREIWSVKRSLESQSR